jgi:hypothetical protein
MFYALDPLASSDSELIYEVRKNLNMFVGLLEQGFGAPYTGKTNTEKCGYISMPRVGFEPTITVF